MHSDRVWLIRELRRGTSRNVVGPRRVNICTHSQVLTNPRLVTQAINYYMSFALRRVLNFRINYIIVTTHFKFCILDDLDHVWKRIAGSLLRSRIYLPIMTAALCKKWNKIRSHYYLRVYRVTVLLEERRSFLWNFTNHV